MHISLISFRGELSLHAPRVLLQTLVVVVIFGSALFHLRAVETTAVPHAYRGFTPGVAELDGIVAALGKSPIETRHADDLRYPVAGRPTLNDRLYFRGGKLGLVTAATVDERYRSREQIIEQFGEPEARVVFQTQEYLDYSEHGLRFICDQDGQTTGTLYFEPMRRRVPAGYPNTNINLRRELAPTKAATLSGNFRVGTSQVSIAPTQFDKLTADSGEKPAHVAEDLFARVAIFQRGSTRIVLVGLDVFGMGMWDLDRLRTSLADQGFPDVIVAMSHTHANVDTIGFYGYYPRDYAHFVMERAEQAVLQAAQQMQPVRSLRAGTAEMSLAGGRVVDLIRNGRDPGVVDPGVSIIQAIGKDGKPIVNVVHLACHPEVIRLEETRGLSPDYVGTLCNEVTRRLGGQTVFLNGALGGMLTPDTRFRTQAAAEKMGRKLADYVVLAAEAAQPSASDQLWMHRRPVEYPITGESVAMFLQNAPEPIDFYQGRVRTEMNVLWIGDAQLITIPGELLPDLGFEIMSHMPGRVRLIVGLANAELGYLIPDYDFRAGGYEERTGPGAAGGAITRAVGLELAARRRTQAD